jgi:hypothetical protein
MSRKSINQIPVFRSEYDPAAAEEGKLDPLGLASIADRISIYTMPGFLERHRRLRFLTIIAIGIDLIDDVEVELEPEEWKVSFWEAYEWLIVSALVTKIEDSNELRGLPGSNKIRTCKDKKISVTSDRYLAISSVFGFHGVYKFLANNLKISIQSKNGNQQLGENGKALLEAWIEDQNLSGFRKGANGNGSDLRKQMIRAIKNSLKNGESTEKWNSPLYEQIALHFNHNRIGKKEKTILRKALKNDTEHHREQFFEFAVSKEAVKIHNETKYTLEEEFHFYRKLINAPISPTLKVGVNATIEYEQFARLLTNAFNESMQFLNDNPRGKTYNDLSQLNHVVKAAQEISKQFEKTFAACRDIHNENWTQRFAPFQWCGQKMNSSQLIRNLIEHHLETQKRKLPNSKRPFLEVTVAELLLGRPGLFNDDPTPVENQFVHNHRLSPTIAFLKDLGDYPDE